jgi:hypothetical protein
VLEEHARGQRGLELIEVVGHGRLAAGVVQASVCRLTDLVLGQTEMPGCVEDRSDGWHV